MPAHSSLQPTRPGHGPDFSREFSGKAGAGFLIGVAILFSACGGGGGGQGNTPSQNHPPVAAVTGIQTVLKRAIVTLDGTPSSDADHDSLTYQWTQTGGATVVLTGAATAKPTFVAPATSGTLSFSLVVGDGKATSAPENASVLVQNRPPVASATQNLTVYAGNSCTLDGSASSDPDGDPVTCAWTQISGPTVTLQTLSSTRASFTAPATTTPLVFSMVSKDGENDSAPLTITVAVNITPSNTPPVANAGANRTVSRRSTVTLQGSGSDADQDPLTYTWTQTAGTPVSIASPASAITSFVAPAVDGDLTFSLVAHDTYSDSAPATVVIHVADQAPTIPTVTLAPTSPKRGDLIQAQVSVSDPDQDTFTLTYAWKRNGVLVAGATSATYPLGNQAKGDVISVDVTASDGTLSSTGSAQTTIADSPATLSGPAPTTAVYGQALSFQLAADDPDGDPTGAFEVEYGPAGFEVASGGLATWTPSGPMFNRTVSVNWAIRLKSDITARLTGTIVVSDPARALPLTRSNLGIPRNGNCLDIQDFDGDGSKSILVGADTLYLLKKGGTSYAQTWVNPFDPGSGNAISAVASGDVDGDGRRETFFTTGTILTALNGTDRRELGHFGDDLAALGGPKSFVTWKALRCADIDGDGKLELVCLGSESSANSDWLFVLDAATLAVKWNISMVGLGSSLAIANVDSDPALEIITSGGYVFDGATHANEWSYGTGFGFAVDAGDLDGDGIAEIVGAVDWSAVRVYSAVLKSPIWEIKCSDIDSIKVIDLDGSGPAEILVGDGQWGNVTAYRYDAASKGAVKIAQINSQEHGVSALAAGDVDGDGKMDLVWGTGLTSSGADFMCIASSDATPVLKWKGPSPQLDGPFTGARLARLSPTQTGIVFATAQTSSGYSGQRVIVLDPATGALTLSSEVDSNWSRASACDVADVLGLGFDQVLLGTANLYDNYFTAFDVATGTKRWSSTKVGTIAAVTHADLNKDGTEDLVGITMDGYVYAWDLAHQVALWQSTGLGAGKDVAVADLDGDGVPEIVALTGTQIVTFTKSTVTSSYLETARRTINGASILIADTDGDGTPEIIVMDPSGYTGATTISRLDASLKTLTSFTLPKASSVFLESSSFPRKNLLVGLGSTGYASDGNRSVIQAVDPRSGAKVWESPALVGTVSPRSLSNIHLGQESSFRLTFGTSRALYLTQ